MFAFTGTPLGRMLNAVRDNPERVEFIGYEMQRVRYIAFIIAGFFAGVAGGMYAMNFEIATAEVVGAGRSGAYLLFTFLGGATVFFGPIIGAILMVLAFVLLSEFTKAWLLYLGPDLPVHGDVRAGRHRQPDHDEPARRARSASSAGWRCRTWRWPSTGAADAGRRRGADRDDLPPAAQHGARARAALPRPDARTCSRWRSWLGAAVGRWSSASALFEIARRRFARRWSEVQERDRAQQEPEPQGGKRRRSACGTPRASPLELKDLRKSFGKTEIIRGANLAVAPGERVAIIGPERRRQVDAVQPDQRPLRRHQRRDPAQRPAHRRPEAVRDQPPRPGAQLPGHATCSRGCRCSRTCAAACSGRWATATRSGSSWPTCTMPTRAPRS